MQRRLFLVGGLGAVSVLAGQAHATGRCSIEAARAFVQITLGQLDAGVTRYDSFRLLQDGRLFRAAWTSDNVFLGVGDVTLADPRYSAVAKMVSTISPKPAVGGNPLGRQAISLDLASFSPDDGTRAVHHTSVPKQIGVLLENWIKVAPLRRPPAGPHVWTAPTGEISGNIDLDFNKGARSCRRPIEKAIISTIGTGAIIAPAPRDIEEFTTGSNTYRQQFVAHFTGKFLRFGIISAQ